MNKKKYSLKEYLAVKGISGLKIKKSYTLQDMLLAKRELVGKAGDCHLYDPEPPVLVREINKVLNKHNMVWVMNRRRKGGKVYRGWDKVVTLDDTLPLPDNWEEIMGEFVGPSGAMGKIIDKLYASGKLKDSDVANQEESIHLHWKLRANLQTPRFQGNTMTINGVSVSTVV